MTKRVQGWSRQIGLSALFAIHVNCFQYNVCGICRCEPSNQTNTAVIEQG